MTPISGHHDDAAPIVEADERLAHLRGALDLTRAGVELAAGIAEGIHRAIASAPLAVVDRAPAGKLARRVHDGVRTGIYQCIRGINRVLFGALDRALELAGPALAPPSPLPSPLVGLLHGVLGDRMIERRNPLRTDMQLRHRGRRLQTTPAALAAALPDAGDRLVVFVHGLAADETCWRRGSTRAWGRPGLDYGRLLAERHAVTPLYVRYNSGLRIADNGRALAALLQQLVAGLPGPPRALVLVGHSMGGLVVRSACHHGRRHGAAWTERLTDIVCLGAPHRGAVLERFGVAAVAALHTIRVTAPIARVLDQRSAGIKDLGHGTFRDDDGDEHTVPHARYHDLAATLGRPGHPLGWAVGDGLVRVPSATPSGRTDIHRTTLAGIGHIQMMCHPEVLTFLEAIVAASKKS